MEPKEIENIKEYLKKLKMLEFKEWVYMPEKYKFRLPEYIGKMYFLHGKTGIIPLKQKKEPLNCSFLVLP